jgi:hypothetical protein
MVEVWPVGRRREADGWFGRRLALALLPLGAVLLSQGGCLDDGRPLAEYLAELPQDAGAEVDASATADAERPVPDAAPFEACSVSGGAGITARFASVHLGAVDVFWVDAFCVEQPYGTLEPGGSKSQGTFAGHPWRFRDARTREVLLDWPGAPLDTAAGATVDVVIP